MVMEYVGKSADGRSLDYRITVHKWHPGFWLFVLKTLWLHR